jgi:hypothetical protein
MKNFRWAIYLLLACIIGQFSIKAQNIFSGEPVQVVGAFNGYATTPYNADYRTTTYRRVTTAAGNPTDGRGQWTTTINIQFAGGDITPINMPGGGGNGFLFISGPSANRFQNKWVFSGIGQGTVDGLNTISCFNCGNDMGLNMSTLGYYTFIFNDCGYTQTNSRYYVAYTSAPPVSVTRTSQTVNPGGSVTVNISTSATPSPEEKIYVRYTTGADFSGTGTSATLQATGVGTSYSATIPAQTPGLTIRYYVFTSTRTLAELSFAGFDAFAPTATEAEKNISVLRYDDNGGANYTQLAPTAAAVSVAGRIVNNAGRGISKASVVAIDNQGQTRTAFSNSFGYFRINELNAGETYTFQVRHKTYTFAPRVLTLYENIDELTFIAR